MADDERRQRRLDALRELAQRQLNAQDGGSPNPPPAPSSSSPGGSPGAAPRPSTRVPTARQHSRLPRAALVIGVIVVLLGVAGALAYHARTPPARTAQRDRVLIATAASGLACPRTFAWSPDGRRLAVLGYASICPSGYPPEYVYTPRLVHVYDAASGAQLDAFAPDDALPTQLLATMRQGPAADATSAQVLHYSGLLWLPDAARLALSFTVTTIGLNAQAVTTAQQIDGLELVNLDGTQSRILMRSRSSAATAALNWDVASGTSTALTSLPLASAYHWDASDTLQSDTLQMAPTAPSTGPIGNPDGGSDFTIWQPQMASYLGAAFVNGQMVPLNPGVSTLLPDVLAWSPDGRHLVDGISFEGLVQPVGQAAPSAQTLAALQLDQAPRLPVRDAGLGRALSGLSSVGAGSYASDQIAWRPDGKLLAVRMVQRPNASPDRAVAIYDCASGALRATLKLSTTPGTLIGSAAGDLPAHSLLWSPDGSHLLGFDPLSATITIWAALPKA